MRDMSSVPPSLFCVVFETTRIFYVKNDPQAMFEFMLILVSLQNLTCSWLVLQHLFLSHNS